MLLWKTVLLRDFCSVVTLGHNDNFKIDSTTTLKIHNQKQQLLKP